MKSRLSTRFVGMAASLTVCLLSSATSAFAEKVTLLHFSDYHSHAAPFYSEGRRQQGGIARAIRYLRREGSAPNAFVFSGGDMINKGSPAWSDKYRCEEWGWFNGIVDAMAFGNHDADYGRAEFERCRALITYPILGANVFDGNGNRIFDVDSKPYLILTTEGGQRVGIFAVAGSDFERLLKADQRPAEPTTFRDRIEVAREVMRALREVEKVSAVVLIGHAHREEEEALARAVPGIDLIFGTHSHIKQELTRIDGTSTWFISPFQYLTYVSRVEIHIDGRGVRKVAGKLVRISAPMPEDRTVAARVRDRQRALTADPVYADLFHVIGTVPRAYDSNNILEVQTPLGRWIMGIVGEAAKADVALSTSSSFRRGIPKGPVAMEDLRATLPYPNKIVVYELRGDELRMLLRIVDRKKGSDSYAQIVAPETIDDQKVYRVATTDYLARVASGYKEFFAARTASETGLEVRDEVRKYVVQRW